MYAIINGTEKHLVKDLLNNNPTDYKISINRLEAAGLDFIKKEKYEKINVTSEGNVGIKYHIEDEEIFDIGYGEQFVGENETSFELFIIPKTSGTTNLTLNFIDYMIDKTVKTKEFIVTISEKLEVKYKEI